MMMSPNDLQGVDVGMAPLLMQGVPASLFQQMSCMQAPINIQQQALNALLMQQIYLPGQKQGVKRSYQQLCENDALFKIEDLRNVRSTPNSFETSSCCSEDTNSDTGSVGSSKKCSSTLNREDEPLPPVQKRFRGGIYWVKGERKKWDGNRFARCCTTCDKLAQGNTLLCKNHGGGNRCKIPGCDKASRGGCMLCSAHGGGRRCIEPDCTKAAAGPTYCRKHDRMHARKTASELSKLPAYFSLLA